MSGATGTAVQAVRLPAAAVNTASDVTASKSVPDNAARTEPPTLTCRDVESWRRVAEQ
jgi:hypothetical protein